jgi:uncharacterized protein (DUF1697 family)
MHAAALPAGAEHPAGRRFEPLMSVGDDQLDPAQARAEMAEVLAQNPFPDIPGNRVVAIFLDEITSPAVLDDVMGLADDEELRLGRREIYVRYGAGMAASKLRIAAAKKGTARNMNTVAKLVTMAATDV